MIQAYGMVSEHAVTMQHARDDSVRASRGAPLLGVASRVLEGEPGLAEATLAFKTR